MKIQCFSSRKDEQPYLTQSFADSNHQLNFIEAHLNQDTANLAVGYDAVCVFVNDQLDAQVIERLAKNGVRLIALRCAGFNNVDLDAAKAANICVVRVPAYSPYAVAEHAVALILTLNRHTHKAHNRVREGNFALDGLLGFDLHGKTIGVIGTGEIGQVFCRIMLGFGCRVIAFDPAISDDQKLAQIDYCELNDLLSQADIVSLHCPLNATTHHLINGETLTQMKPGAMLINTSRGGLVDTQAVIAALKSAQLGGLGIDVYEEESELFFEDCSSQIISDDLLMRLTTFPNVLITGHQGFFTQEALHNIAETTRQNVDQFADDGLCANQLYH